MGGKMVTNYYNKYCKTTVTCMDISLVGPVKYYINIQTPDQSLTKTNIPQWCQTLMSFTVQFYHLLPLISKMK